MGHAPGFVEIGGYEEWEKGMDQLLREFLIMFHCNIGNELFMADAHEGKKCSTS